MTGPEFAAAHRNDSTEWTAADFEAEMNLAEIDAYTTPDPQPTPLHPAACPGRTPNPVPETLETIRYTADVVCIRDGSVLTIERGWPPHKGQLALPGGHVDPGETALAAAARELLEETGVRVDTEALTLVGVYDRPHRDPRGRYITVAYTVTVTDETTAHAGDDAAAVQWVPLNDPGDLAFDHSQIVADALRQAAANTAPGLTLQPAIHHSA